MSASEQLVYLLDEAFAGKGIEETNESQSLLMNLSAVTEALWRAPPPGGTRTIESIALHVGSCKVMYDEYAFGEGNLQWDDPTVQPWPEGAAPMEETIEWLRRVHAALTAHVASLDDAALRELRPANWGEMREARWLISMLIQHDTYHAGEINHIRSLLSSDDRWKWG